MKKREFDKLLKNCSTEGVLDVKGLSPDVKREMGLYIIRNRGPVLVDLTEDMDNSWLAAMGYLYRTKGFLHTCEHRIR